MKRTFLILGVSFIIFSCSEQSNTIKILRSQVDSLQVQIAKTYRPGLGEFMSNIQVHHEKLWFAAQYQNWELAGFEINEIKESLGDIELYCSDRPEVKQLIMINPAIDSVRNAVQEKNFTAFKGGFILLTNTCNNCHRETNHAFNVIKLPETPPFSNQEFKKQ